MTYLNKNMHHLNQFLSIKLAQGLGSGKGLSDIDTVTVHNNSYLQFLELSSKIVLALDKKWYFFTISIWYVNGEVLCAMFIVPQPSIVYWAAYHYMSSILWKEIKVMLQQLVQHFFAPVITYLDIVMLISSV